MGEINATPLPGKFGSQKKFIPIRSLLIVLGILVVIWFGANAFSAYFERERELREPFERQQFVKKMTLPCPVPKKFCKDAVKSVTYSEPEKTIFSGIVYELPEGTPVLATVDNLSYNLVPLKDVPLIDNTLIHAEYTNNFGKYELGYLFSGAATYSTPVLKSNEQIGMIQRLSEKSPLPLRLLFSVKDVVKNKYLNLQPSADGNSIEIQQ